MNFWKLSTSASAWNAWNVAWNALGPDGVYVLRDVSDRVLNHKAEASRNRVSGFCYDSSWLQYNHCMHLLSNLGVLSVQAIEMVLDEVPAAAGFVTHPLKPRSHTTPLFFFLGKVLSWVVVQREVEIAASALELLACQTWKLVWPVTWCFRISVVALFGIARRSLTSSQGGYSICLWMHKL
jgi:hypothetical protein